MVKKQFADFWDQISSRKGAKSRADKVLKYIKKHSSKSNSILELGVGNGKVLSLFPKKYSLSGLDIEKRYVELSKQKLPNAHLFVSSMHNFKVNKKFDVIFSIFDSINFLINFEQWKQTFRNAYNHLNDNGLFIFDMYTPLMLEKAKTWTNFFKEPFGFMMDKGIVKGNRLTWDFMIFEKKKNGLYELHNSLFHERIFTSTKVEKELKKLFTIIEKVDGDTLKGPTKKTTRLLYVAKKIIF